MAKSKNMIAFRISEEQRRIESKCEVLDKHSCSEDLFDELRDAINTLSQDESSHDFEVGDTFNFGTEWEIELLLEIIRDLRWFTQYNKDNNDEQITEYGLDYLRKYF